MSLSSWRVLITRPEAECAALAQTLAQQQVFASCLPLLGIRANDTPPALLAPLSAYCAVVVVSKPAARLAVAALQRLGHDPAQLCWFSVGAATAQVLAEYGIRACYPEDGDDSEALWRLTDFQQSLRASEPRVLIMRGEEGRDWLAETLRAQAVTVDFLPLYQRYLPPYAAGTLTSRVKSDRLNALVVSSGQGLVNLVACAAEDWPSLAHLPLFVPSERVAMLAREQGAGYVINCRGASAAALLSALAEHQPIN